MIAQLVIGMAANLLCGAANAAEIPYSVAVGPNEKLTGIVFLDDSSGEAQAVKGTATGPVSGDYALDATTTRIEMSGPAAKLTLYLDRFSGQLSAHLDNCAAGPDRCTTGATVILWEK